MTPVGNLGLDWEVDLRQGEASIKSFNDEVNDVLGNVHCTEGRVNANHPLIRI